MKQKNNNIYDFFIIFLNIWLVELLLLYISGIAEKYNFLIDKQHKVFIIRVIQIMIVFFMLKITKIKFEDAGIKVNKKDFLKALKEGIWLSMCLGCVVYFTGWASRKFFDIDIINLITSKGKITITVVLMTCIIGPLFEELAFRGILLNGFLQKLSPVVSIILSSAVFSAMHFRGIAIIPLIGGLLFSISYIKTKNLIVPIIIHSTGNFAILFADRIFVYF